MKAPTLPIAIRRAWPSRLRLLPLLFLCCIAAAGAYQAPQPAAAAGGQGAACVAHSHARQSCHHSGRHRPSPARPAHAQRARTNYWYVDANGTYWYVDPTGRRWQFDPALGALSYVDPNGHHWLVDLSGDLYYLDPYTRLWYVDPAGRFWYADPYGRFWFYVDPSGHYGIVDPNAGNYPGSGYVAPAGDSGSGDPRFSSDANGNWVTSLPADSGTIGVVDGCVSYIPSASSTDDQTSYQGGNC